ncbi:MAG: HNH endonuclease [Fimbriimonadales bacterium]|nr:HNH endonuclease [Fimbriimonadales bacterium]
MRKKSKIPKSIKAQILADYNHQCAYCKAHDAALSVPLTIDHILPKARGGADEITNLCPACWWCNLNKLDQTEAVDPETGEVVPLYHPRAQRWEEHFEWSPDGAFILGKTPIGRATVAALQLNGERQANLRRIWMTLGLHPNPAFRQLGQQETT